MKKIIIIVSSVLGFVIVALLAAPMFVSVDQFRPQVVIAAEKSIKGKVELGKLNLSLFPLFKVSSNSLKVSPLSDSGFVSPVLETQSVSFQSSLLSLISNPNFKVVIKNPKLWVQQQLGKTNVESLIIEPTADVAAKPAQTAEIKSKSTAPSIDESLSGLPSWIRSRVEAASFSLDVQEANVIYSDEGSSSELSGVNFLLKNIGLNQKMIAQLDARVAHQAEDFSVNGPISANVEIISRTDNMGTLLLDVNGSNDFNDLEMKASTFFVKAKGVPFGASFEGLVKVSKTIDLDFKKFSFEFGTLLISGALKVINLMDDANAVVQLSLKSNALNLADLKSYSPMVASYKLVGKSNFSAEVNGNISNPDLSVALSAEGIQGSSPDLATPIRDLNLDMRVSGQLSDPVVDLKKIQMRIGKGSDVFVRGTVRGIEAPKVDFYVESKNLDADEIIGTPAQVTTTAQKSSKASPTAQEEAASTLPLDESLSQMAPMIDETLKNPNLDKLAAKVQTKFSKIKFMGADYSDAGLNLSLSKRVLSISKTSIRAYKGVVAIQGSMKLVPVTTEFSFVTNLSNVSMGELVRLHAPDWQGAMSGSALGLFEVSGRGFSKESLQNNLRGKISGEIKDGKTNLAVIQVVNQVLSSLPKNFSSGLSSQAKEKSKDQFIEGDFETMKLEANIVGRSVELNNIDAVFKSSQEKLGKFRFSAKGDVSFDQDVRMLGTAFLSPSLIKINELKGPSGQIEIPLKFSGKMYDPKVDYEYSIKKITESAGKKLLKSEGQKAAQKVAEKLIPELEKKVPANLKKDLKKNLKNLFK